MLRYFFYTTVVLLLSVKSDAQINNYDSFLRKHNQVIYVTTKTADAIIGTIRIYERKNPKKHWKLVDSFPVTVGRTGLAWDEHTELPHSTLMAFKREGDGKSPAGIFKLGPVFSYHYLKKPKMPFQQFDSSDICVDDMKSVYYNRLTDTDTVAKKDWNSFEYMRRKDDLYEYGIWVLYNSSPCTPGNGSCIFLHVWENEHTPTAGCTAMSRENMLKLISFLDAGRNPVLLQVVD